MPEVYGHKIHTKRLSTNVDAFQKIFENDTLTKADFRIFGFLCCRLDSEHFTRIDTEQISETLIMKKKKVEESIDILVEEGIIERGGDTHIKKGYRFTYTATSGKGGYDKK